MVCGQSKVGKIVLHTNGENAELWRKLLTIHGQRWSSETPCQSIYEKKTKGPPMVARLLLHDPSNMSIGGVSGKRKFCIWVGMLEGYSRCQEAFCILEDLLCADAVHSNVLAPPPLRRSAKGRAVGQKMPVKIHHAKETLQLFNILRGWAKFNLGGVSSHGGCPCRRNLVAKNFQRRHCIDAFFKIGC